MVFASRVKSNFILLAGLLIHSAYGLVSQTFLLAKWNSTFNTCNINYYYDTSVKIEFYFASRYFSVTRKQPEYSNPTNKIKSPGHVRREQPWDLKPLLSKWWTSNAYVPQQMAVYYELIEQLIDGVTWLFTSDVTRRLLLTRPDRCLSW